MTASTNKQNSSIDLQLFDVNELFVMHKIDTKENKPLESNLFKNQSRVDFLSQSSRMLCFSYHIIISMKQLISYVLIIR